MCVAYLGGFDGNFVWNRIGAGDHIIQLHVVLTKPTSCSCTDFFGG